MLKIETFESSSSGNLHLISTAIEGKKKRLLIECGLPIKKVMRYLDFDLDVSGCLLSHYHGDHSGCKQKGKAGTVHAIMKSGVDVYCSQGTAEQLKLTGHRLKIIKPGRFQVDGFKCLSFLTNHDTLGAMGFLIDTGPHRILFATDTGSMPYRFKGLTHIILECNYSDLTMTDIDPWLIKRVNKTHMSLDDCIEFLEMNDLSRVMEIRLIHLSSRNADADYFKSEIQKFGKPVII